MLTGMVLTGEDASRIAGEFVSYGFAVPQSIKATNRHFGQRLATAVEARASGRPGPRAPTGDYRRSIRYRPLHYVGEDLAAVGTDAPQGRRLELGFVGTDSLGRVYHQPPFPHFGPAFDEIAPQYYTAIRAVLGP